MKKNFIKVFSIIFANFMISTAAFASSDLGNGLKTSLKQSTYEPGYFSIVVSLIFVIALIYVTGIVYTKLNKISVKTVRKELHNDSDVKPVILSTTPVGHDKNLQVIEIAGQKLLIGVSNNSINLIKELSKPTSYQGSYEQKNLQEVEVKAEDKVEDVQPNTEEPTKEEEPINPEDFGLYKKYLR